MGWNVRRIINLPGLPEHLELRANAARSEVFGPTIFTSGFYVGQPFTRNVAQIDSVVKAQRAAGFDTVKLHRAIDAEAYQTLCEDDAALCPVSVHPIPAAAHPKGELRANRGNLELQKAFNQFDNNIHVASGSSIGPVAPGLHNFKERSCRHPAVRALKAFVSPRSVPKRADRSLWNGLLLWTGRDRRA